MTARQPLLAAVLAALAFALAACGDDDSGSGSADSQTTQSEPADACGKDQLELKSAGRLTVGTDKPAFPPYFEDDDPTNGNGFESAVAYAVAEELGFQNSEVEWVTVPFNSSFAPGPKRFDFDINQISITPQRSRQVDFSKPYYTAPQAVLVPKGSSLQSPQALADLKDAQIGVQLGTTSLDAVRNAIQPTKQPRVFNDSNDVVSALKQGQVDAVVVDLPTALFLSAAEVEGSKVVGQFAAPGGDRWGLLLQKDSPLTDCVNGALTSMQRSGELEQLTDKWMSASTGAPQLQ